MAGPGSTSSDRDPADPGWIIPVSASEHSAGKLGPGNAQAARAAFDRHGCALLQGVFAPAAIAAMHREYVAQLGAMDQSAMQAQTMRSASRLIKVGDSRYDVVPRMTGGFAQPEMFANGILLGFLRPLLGADLHLSSFTVVVSHPGAAQQRPHRDYPHLFHSGVGLHLPPHAVNVVVPLVDVDLETGPTGVWLGSHRSESSAGSLESLTVSPFRCGDCMAIDYRTLHAGLPNRSGRARPIVYMVYTRPWFFDFHNYVRVRRVPLDMSLDQYNLLPAEVRPLLSRAGYYAALKQQGTSAADEPAMPHGANPAPGAIKVGRNDPCPCGSGKKFKHCHGSFETGGTMPPRAG
jgi:ectoine hydroxylase-related dioxygenase (phytanoyl-CoA dioxygenase family)